MSLRISVDRGPDFMAFEPVHGTWSFPKPAQGTTWSWSKQHDHVIHAIAAKLSALHKFQGELVVQLLSPDGKAQPIFEKGTFVARRK